MLNSSGSSTTPRSFGTDLEVKTADVGDFPTDDFLTIPGPSKLRRRGTFTQKFTSINKGTIDIILKARILPADTDHRPNAWVYNELIEGSGTGSFVLYGTPMIIRLKNFNIFEALVS
jgi:hypothetical protein